MKQEWRKIVKVHPVILFKDDILGLLSLLSACDSNLTATMSVQFGYEGLKQTFDTLDEVREFERSAPTNEFSADVRIRDSAGNTVRGVHLTMFHNYVDYQIFSDDEAWYLGRIAQLTQFFRLRRPWHAPIQRPLLNGGPLLALLAFMVAVPAFKKHMLFLAVPASALCLVLSAILYGENKGKLFPYVLVYPSEKPIRRVSFETISLAVAVLTLVATVVRSIVMPLIMGGPKK